MRHVVDEHGAGTAFGAIAADFRAGQPEFVAEHHRERFLRHYVDAAILAVDVERDEALDRARRALPVHRRRAEQVRGRRSGSARGDDAFDVIAPRATWWC